jgi:hypothetical protein
MHQSKGTQERGTRAGVVALVFSFSIGLGIARAQLAITEVMSDAARTHNGTPVPHQSDFWELTNFGTNAIDLTGYQFSDNDNVPRPLFADGVLPLKISPGQSVIFVRTDETVSETQFRAWWGACLAADVPIRFYPKELGFNPKLSGVRLWNASGELVDSVDFGAARRGVTFISDTNTGVFGVHTQPGSCGACNAATADDLGSPGRACGPIPLRWEQQPSTQVACAGSVVTFTARALGLPRPLYQWFSNNVAIPGARNATLTITNVQLHHAGFYRVEVSNGLASLTSSNAALLISTTPVPPTVLSQPLDAAVHEGQTAQFRVSVCGYPLVTYQWFSNNVALPGETGPVLRVPNCTLSMSGTEYCVRVENPLGTNTACAGLTVRPDYQLFITEVMSFSHTNCPQNSDWFELTNLGTNSVNLLGFRFNDSFSFDGGVTNTQPVVLARGQSAIFVENLTPADFVQWWGAENLPPGLPIITYFGFGLSDLGDELYVWNAAAESPEDVVTSVSFAASASGVSLRFDESFDCFSGCPSEVGKHGAFHAPGCGDIGSPGYTSNGPPRMVSIHREPSGETRITWFAIQGKTYRLEWSAVPQGAVWNSLGEFTATSSLLTRTQYLADVDQRFYRAVQVSP